MVKITDLKSIFPTFKYFKSVYTTINKSESIFCYGNNSREIEIYFEFPGTTHMSLLKGTLIVTDYFSEWAVGKYFRMNMTDIQVLSKILKKNIVALEYDDSTFSFIFIDKETAKEKKITITSLIESNNLFKNKINEISKLLSNTAEIDHSMLNDNIIEFVYEDDKLLEIPTKKILAYQKNTNIIIKYSNLINDTFRYISLNSETEICKLSQYLLTI